jgi:hypothetical protein
MNYTSSTFDMTYNVSKFTIFTPNDAINKMFLMNSLALMQSTVNGTMYIYNSATYTVGTVDNLIPKN